MNKCKTQVMSLGLTAIFSLSACVSSEKNRTPDSENRSVGCGTQNYPVDNAENGFVILDVLQPTKVSKNSDKVMRPLICPEDLAKAKELKLQP